MKKSTKIIATLATTLGVIGAAAGAVKLFGGKKHEEIIDGDSMPKPENSEYDAQMEAAKDFSKEETTEEEE